MPAIRIGVVSPSSPVGSVELHRGVERLRRAGFDVRVHAQALARHYVSAGTDQARADALLDVAFDDAIDVVWCARGGYGAAKVVALLAEATKTRGVPRPKLLVGYSDITVLHEYVRHAWGWRTLHAPMVAAGPGTTDAMWAAVDAIVRGDRPDALPYESAGTLRWMSNGPATPIDAEVIGGNLSLWASMAGTPWQPSGRGKVVFLEDLGEKLYRIDRMAVQCEQAGMFDGAAAIVLGDFTDCDDEAPTVAGPTPDAPRIPLRPVWSLDDGLHETFGRIAERLRIPLARGLPVGHGPNFWPLMLGARHRLTPDGALCRID